MGEEGQTSLEKNASFFGEHHAEYRRRVRGLQTSKNIFDAVTAAIAGVDRLLDVGNGGIFGYDVSAARCIIAIDIAFTPQFVGEVPSNAELKHGNATALPEPDSSADAVLMNMLLHHLTGNTAAASINNVSLAVTEAFRVLKPGGKVIVVESCVPRWFYALEKAVYRTASSIIDKVSTHPATLQYPRESIESLLSERFVHTSRKRIRMGAWVLQFGRFWPSALTPTRPYLFVAEKA